MTGSDGARRGRVLVRLYLWSRSQQRRAIRLLWAWTTGVWLGVLDRAMLDQVDDAYYVGSAKGGPYDYLDAEYNEQGLFHWERDAIEAYFASCGRLGVMGAGGGRECLALIERGFEVEGWECQAAFVELGNRLAASRGHGPVIDLVPRDAVPRAGAPLDGVIIGWSAYMLIPGRARRVAVLRDLGSRVESGAPLLLSFYTRKPRDRRYWIAATTANVFRRLLRREPADIGDYLDPNYVHVFTEPEVREELRDGGFELVWFSSSPYGHAVARAV